MKIFSLFLLTFSFLCAPLVTHADFPDINDSPYQKEILELQKLGIIEGFPDGEFKPKKLVTRAEFLKITTLAKAKKEERTGPSFGENFPFGQEDTIKIDPPCFTDFKGGIDAYWFEPYVCWAKEREWVNGYPEGDFRGEKNVILAEGAKMLVAGKTSPYFPGPDHWAQPYLNELNLQIIPTSILSVDQILTREEVASMAWRYYIAEGLDVAPHPAHAFLWNGEGYDRFEVVGYGGNYGQSYQYLKNSGGIYSRWEEFSEHFEESTRLIPIEGADVGTFAYLPFPESFIGNVGAANGRIPSGILYDQFGVFDLEGKRIEGSSGGSLKIIEDGTKNNELDIIAYATDDESVYLLLCGRCEPELIQGSDAESFELLGGGVWKDKTGVYYQKDPLPKLLQNQELTFTSAGKAVGNDNIYYFDASSILITPQNVKKGDPVEYYDALGTLQNFTYIGALDDEHYLSDGTKIYMTGNNGDYQNLMEVEADLNSFEFFVLDDGYSNSPIFAFDESGVFVSGKKVPGSAGGTIEVMNEFHMNEASLAAEKGFYLKDDQAVYLASCFFAFFCELDGILPEAKVNDVQFLGEGYATSNGHAYYWHVPIPHADANSLVYLGESYAKDDNHVFYLGEVLEQIDVSTFQYLGSGYIQDAKGIYYKGDIFLGVPLFELDVKNPDTFELYLANDENLYCTLPFAKDDQNIFFSSLPLKELDVDSFEFLDLYGFFFKDKNQIYQVESLGFGACNGLLWKAVDNIDAGSFEPLNPYYFKNKGQIYWNGIGGEHKLIEEADVNSFEALVKKTVDHDAFLYSVFSKDANRAYYKNQIIPDVDVATFEYDAELKKLKDKNGSYTWQELSERIKL